MNKLWITSDWHEDLNGPMPRHLWPDPKKVDCAILAGDICNLDTVNEIKEMYGHVVYIPGNHEYYNKFLWEVDTVTPSLSVTYLGDLKIIAATLWTDFDLYGDAAIAMDRCRKSMNDFRLIGMIPKPYKPFTPEYSREIFHNHLEFIRTELEKKDYKQVAVVTHHCPSERSVPDLYKNSLTSAGFASRLDEFILDHEPDLWIHGHTHSSFDYRIGKTRIVCNPYGYIYDRVDNENPDYNPKLIVSL